MNNAISPRCFVSMIGCALFILLAGEGIGLTVESLTPVPICAHHQGQKASLSGHLRECLP